MTSESEETGTDATQLWSLYNAQTLQQIDQLTLGELRAICLSLVASAHSQCYVWCEGWTEWNSLKDHSELLRRPEKTQSQLKPPPPPDNVRRGFLKKETQTSTKTQSQLAPRKTHRYNVRYDIEVISQNRSFRTNSVDISLGGIRVEATLPDWIAGYCTVIVSNHRGQKLEFVATIVENQNVKDKTRLEFQSSASVAILAEWLSRHSPQGGGTSGTGTSGMSA